MKPKTRSAKSLRALDDKALANVIGGSGDPPPPPPTGSGETTPYYKINLKD